MLKMNGLENVIAVFLGRLGKKLVDPKSHQLNK
jgi:hypothetical protein